jgi:hypothetical protein
MEKYRQDHAYGDWYTTLAAPSDKHLPFVHEKSMNLAARGPVLHMQNGLEAQGKQSIYAPSPSRITIAYHDSTIDVRGIMPSRLRRFFK